MPSPANGLAHPVMTTLEQELIAEIRGHGKRTVAELGEMRSVLLEIRDRLPAPVAHPEVDSAAAGAKVSLLTAVRDATKGQMGARLVQATWAAVILLVLGAAGAMGLKMDLLRPGGAMPHAVTEALGYAAPGDATVGEAP